MLSNTQFGKQLSFFGWNDYYDDSQMTYDQFRDRADFFHATRPGNSWKQDRTEHYGTPIDKIQGNWYNQSAKEFSLGESLSHVGTEKAAHDRARKVGYHYENYWLQPLKHTGEFANPDEPHRDVTGLWGHEKAVKELFGSKKTLRYRNAYEDEGSISAVGPSQNFQSYPDYVREVPEDKRSGYQRDFLEHVARVRHGGYEEYPNKNWVERRPHAQDSLDWVTFMNTRVSEPPVHPSVAANKTSK